MSGIVVIEALYCKASVKYLWLDITILINISFLNIWDKLLQNAYYKHMAGIFSVSVDRIIVIQVLSINNYLKIKLYYAENIDQQCGSWTELKSAKVQLLNWLNQHEAKIFQILKKLKAK